LNLECDHGSECAGAHQEIIISWNRISLKKDEIFFFLKERFVLDERKNGTAVNVKSIPNMWEMLS